MATNNSINLPEGLIGTIIQNTGTGFTSTTATYPSTAGTVGNVLTSDGTNWQSSQSSLLNGFISWGGAGNYFDDSVLGSFTVLRPGTGYTVNKVTSWTAPQTVTGLTAGTTWIIYVDNTGTLQKTAIESDSLYTNQILLFQCLRDSTSPTNHQLTVKENHIYNFPPYVSAWADDIIGTVLSSRESGGNITINGTQKIQINGANELFDNSVSTIIPDSGGVAVSFYQYFTLAGGAWAQYTSSDTFGAFYNNAGTVTALGGNKFGVYTLYAAKDNLNSSTPVYIAVLDTAQYNTAALALNAINAGTIAIATNELANLELAQLGFIVFGQSANAITNVVIAKKIIATSGLFSSNTITTVQFNVLVGGALNTVVSVPPSATSGIPLISQGVASNPAFGTALVAGGGTGLTSATAFALIAGGTTATGNFQSLASGSAGQVLQSNGNAALPTYSTPTYPSASGTAGKILRSDGTNNVYTTSTFADTYAINTLLHAGAANVITGLATSNFIQNIAIQVFTSTGTYTPTTGMVKCLMFCLGGGGGSAGVANGSAGTSGSSGGGGAGGFSIKLSDAATVGASKAVTIGDGGTAGTSAPTNGGTGGDTSIGTICVGKGGGGSSGTTGGTGGAAGTGDITIPGMSGGTGHGQITVLTANIFGAPGISALGGGFGLQTFGASTTGATPSLYGNGAGGANTWNGEGAAAGGAGSKGIAFVIELIAI